MWYIVWARVESKKLEYGHGPIYALGSEDGHVPTFWLLMFCSRFCSYEHHGPRFLVELEYHMPRICLK